MSSHRPSAPVRFKFGLFDLNPQTGELRKRGVPVRISGQPIQILVRLLAHPGEVVTREQLRAEVWGEALFVDFEHGLNAAINKPRRALGDSADNPRFIETIPGRGYRFIAALTDADQETQERDSTGAEELTIPPSPIMLTPPSTPRRTHWLLWAAPAFMLLLIVNSVSWRQVSSLAPSTQAIWKLKRITSDTGLSSSPALSPDGKLVAYSSDRDAPGHQDIYVQQVTSGGQAIRLTFDGVGNQTPDFSPDGTKLVFRSARDGGGIYEIPAFGGQARLLADEGFDPKYSPDGKEVAYWVGADNIAQAVPGNGSIWVVPVAGDRPRQAAKNLSSARQPIWAPDGKRLLVIGYTSQSIHDSSALDWWLVPAREGVGRPIRVGLQEVLSRANLQTKDAAGNLERSVPVPVVPKPRCWLAAAGTVVFAIEHGDTRNLWWARISEEGTMTGEVQRLTTGAEQEADPACAANAIAFVNGNIRIQVWSLPFDPVRGKATAGLERITSGLATEEAPSVSEDGRRAAFLFPTNRA